MAGQSPPALRERYEGGLLLQYFVHYYVSPEKHAQPCEVSNITMFEILCGPHSQDWRVGIEGLKFLKELCQKTNENGNPYSSGIQIIPRLSFMVAFCLSLVLPADTYRIFRPIALLADIGKLLRISGIFYHRTSLHKDHLDTRRVHCSLLTIFVPISSFLIRLTSR